MKLRNSKRLSSQKSEQDLKPKVVASSLYLKERDRQGKAEKEIQKDKPLKANTCTSTKAYSVLLSKGEQAFQCNKIQRQF